MNGYQFGRQPINTKFLDNYNEVRVILFVRNMNIRKYQAFIIDLSYL